MGYEKYKPYLKRVYNTKYDNVAKFIAYFKIGKSEFEGIMRKMDDGVFYV